jgi:SSS family solute:Na+ symporter
MISSQPTLRSAGNPVSDQATEGENRRRGANRNKPAGAAWPGSSLTSHSGLARGAAWWGFPILVLASTTTLQAAEVTTSVNPRAGLHALDWLVVAIYAAAVLAIGWLASRKKKSTVEYFIGDRGFGSLTIGISMFVTLFSTISYLSGPGEVIRYGPGIFFGSLLAIPLSYPVLAYVLLPALMKRRVVSLYELFETRLGARIRTLGATMFIIYRTLWMAVLMHFGSVALSVILGVGDGAIPVITITAGLIAVIYTSMGGLRAVITVDVLQFTVLLIGVIATLAVVTARFGGFGWMPVEWDAQWNNQPFFSMDPTVRVTVVTAAILAFMLDTAHGVDQTQVQRDRKSVV